MPSNVVKSFAKKLKKSVSEVEKLWIKAISLTSEFFNKSELDFNDKNWEYCIGILQNMLGLEERYTLDYLSSNLTIQEFIDEVMTSAPFVKAIPTLRPKKDDNETEEDEEDDSGIDVIELGYK